MALNVEQERQQAHKLLDLLPPAKLGTVRSLLEIMIDDHDELTDQDRAVIQAGLSLARSDDAGVGTERVCAVAIASVSMANK